jgi:hypothetical protein
VEGPTIDLCAAIMLHSSSVSSNMSWKLEVQTIGATTWSSNSLRFATHDEAHLYGLDLERP